MGTDRMVVFKNKTAAIRILSSTTEQRQCESFKMRIADRG